MATHFPTHTALLAVLVLYWGFRGTSRFVHTRMVSLYAESPLVATAGLRIQWTAGLRPVDRTSIHCTRGREDCWSFIVVLADSCAVCVKQLARIRSTIEAISNLAPFEIHLVSADGGQLTRELLNALPQLDVTQWSTTDGRAFRAHTGVFATPTFFVLDGAGTVRAVSYGFNPQRSDLLGAAIKAQRRHDSR